MARQPDIIKAAGGVLYRIDPDVGPVFLVVHRSCYRDWSLPKGKLDPGEDYAVAALREIREETGYKCALLTYLGAVSYETTGRHFKIVKYWLMETVKGGFRPNAEVDRVEWIGLDAARRLLSYQRDVRLVERAAALLHNPTSTRMFLVRHANAGVRSRWKGPDKKRPLTEKGREQANSVAAGLTHHPVTAVLSSPAVRSIQTVEPLAARLELEVVTYKVLSVDTDLDAVRNFLSELEGTGIVISGHREWIGTLIEDLDLRGVPLHGSRKWPKGSTWIIDYEDGKPIEGRYLGRFI